MTESYKAYFWNFPISTNFRQLESCKVQTIKHNKLDKVSPKEKSILWRVRSLPVPAPV